MYVVEARASIEIVHILDRERYVHTQPLDSKIEEKS